MKTSTRRHFEGSFKNDESEQSELELLITIMQQGSRMLKIDRKSRGAMKTFILDDDLLGFRYQPCAKSNRVDLKSIKSVALTPLTRSVKNFKFSRDNCFTVEIINRHPLVVLASEKRIAESWVRGLALLITQKAAVDGSLHPKRKWLFDTFDSYDNNRSGSIDFKELIKIVASLNIAMTKEQLMNKYKEFNQDLDESVAGKKSGLDKAQFASFFESISKRSDIEETVMAKYSSNGTYLTCEELHNFLTKSQGMTNATVEDCKLTIQSYEMIDEYKSKNCLSIDGFSCYLLSKEGNIYDDSHDSLYQDFTQPLSHYFISSSHNTYLEGDQLRGTASVEAYISALKKGCRCVELDCWDGDDGEPVIYHGHTLVNKILFKDVIQAIEKFAFTTSQYPVILSLENHCSISQQEKMASYLKTILGDKLFSKCVDTSLKDLPSPEFFKNKILIKGKKFNDDGFMLEGEEVEEEEDDEDVQLDEQGNAVPNKLDMEPNDKQSSEKKKKIKLSPELSRLVNHCKAVHFDSFAKSKEKGKCYEMSSFGESLTKKLVKESTLDFIEYNKKQLSRIYPSGSRVDSSNFNPLMAWSVGCQIVALNFQTESVMMDLYLAKFRTNGNSGYILKPDYMRNDSIKSPPKMQKLKVEVISGQQIPKVSGTSKGEIIDPYVTVAVYDEHGAKQIFQTKSIKDNGFNPRWNESFEFEIKNPDLAMLRFAVYDEDIGKDDFIAQFSTPLLSIKPGYRQVSLNGHGTKSLFPAALLVHVTNT
ncbi:1-phosphatidylinositol 4,5-bisphosphate phosphodiesterase eta-2-like [Xenia sp. Carnegie-2017]|uniref:1-phosphatidylinositol 4,5-bisphosphate phosphodiesterase eta-2-like n=1 Tax=Xenia sp. Carnegie-2017 TaxID=2897299 RepID=UPI001F03EF7C|nr:1-phosphatidylinositol 4,5-bisphosphate phosphodiesterase eta-2-like [Xenia sp. Carnegie-2017]